MAQDLPNLNEDWQAALLSQPISESLNQQFVHYVQEQKRLVQNFLQSYIMESYNIIMIQEYLEGRFFDHQDISTYRVGDLVSASPYFIDVDPLLPSIVKQVDLENKRILLHFMGNSRECEEWFTIPYFFPSRLQPPNRINLQGERNHSNKIDPEERQWFLQEIVPYLQNFMIKRET